MSGAISDAISFARENNNDNYKRIGGKPKSTIKPSSNHGKVVPPLTHKMKHAAKSVGRFMLSMGIDPNNILNLYDLIGYKFVAEVLFGHVGHHPIEFLKQAIWIFVYMKGPAMLKSPIVFIWIALQTLGVVIYYGAPVLLAL